MIEGQSRDKAAEAQGAGKQAADVYSAAFLLTGRSDISIAIAVRATALATLSHRGIWPSCETYTVGVGAYSARPCRFGLHAAGPSRKITCNK